MQHIHPGPDAPQAVPEADRLAHRQSGARIAAHLGSTVRLLAAAFLVALAIRTFLVQPFAIPSGSMSPLLQSGDFVLVDKAAYGWTLASLPLAQPPLSDAGTDGLRIAGHPVRRGDVIVFASPDGQDYVKRMVARGGERVAMRKGRLVLNGQEIGCVPVGGGLCRETFPEGTTHLVHDDRGSPLSDMAETTVPAGHYFVLGDNRAHSADSRLPRTGGGVGMVPQDLVIGQAARIFFSANHGVHWERIGQSID